MQPHDNSSPIRITLDISVPIGGGQAIVTREREPKRIKSTLGIDHPDDGGTTFVKKICDRWYMCATGTVSQDVRHIFARVYEGTATPDPAPPQDIDTGWASTINSTAWKIDLLPLPAGTDLATSKKLAVWHETGTGGYQGPEVHTFTAQSSNYTYCETYGKTFTAQKPKAKDWSALPGRWQFSIAGVSNSSSCNCVCLNGTWLLKREKDTLLWHCQFDASFADPKKPCWWRLVFNPKDGFWYLECVGARAQPVGTSITYRRHESAWDPCGANEMILLTDSGYCHVPESVTVYPG